jgi:hypothetical protein
VPADLAEKSLRVFLTQSGFEVLFSSDAASGVRTNAIKGEFLPGEAVKKMPAGTTLYERDERDERGGVFRIAATPRRKAPGAALSPGPSDRPGEPTSDARSRDPPLGTSSAAQPNPIQTSQPQHNESPPVKNRNALAIFAAWLANGIAVDAQSAANPAIAPKSDEVVELSPFNVEEPANAYLAKSTLGGTRIRTDVADVGAAISILTPKLIGDLASTNAGSLLTIVPNGEVARRAGQFLGR